MNEESAPDRTFSKTVSIIFIAALCLALLACAGFDFPALLVILLTTGWAFYLAKVSGEVTVEWTAVAVAATALVLFTVGVHWFCHWLVSQHADPERRNWTFRRSLQVVALVLFVFVAGTSMIGIVHQLTWLATSDEPYLESSGRKASRRSMSKNNLKQQGLAFHNYHDEYATLAVPTVSRSGRAMHSWITLLLPYLDQQPLFETIDLSEPWTSIRNTPAFRQVIRELLNPGVVDYHNHASEQSDTPARAHYSANALVIPPNRPLALKDISDGTSRTILAGEINAGFPAWGDPMNVREVNEGINRLPTGFGSPSKGGAHFLLVDGSVRFISDETDPRILHAFSTPNGGETVDDF